MVAAINRQKQTINQLDNLSTYPPSYQSSLLQGVTQSTFLTISLSSTMTIRINHNIYIFYNILYNAVLILIPSHPSVSIYVSSLAIQAAKGGPQRGVEKTHIDDATHQAPICHGFRIPQRLLPWQSGNGLRPQLWAVHSELSKSWNTTCTSMVCWVSRHLLLQLLVTGVHEHEMIRPSDSSHLI